MTHDRPVLGSPYFVTVLCMNSCLTHALARGECDWMWRVMDIMGVKFRPPKYWRAASSESLSRMTAMSSIAVRSICGFVQLLVFLGVVLFAPAWTIGSWWGILMALPMVFRPRLTDSR